MLEQVPRLAARVLRKPRKLAERLWRSISERSWHSVSGMAYDKIFSDPKLTMQQASKMMADAISKEELSPRQFGRACRTLSTISRTPLVKQKANLSLGYLVSIPISWCKIENVQNVLRTEVNNLNP